MSTSRALRASARGGLAGALRVRVRALREWLRSSLTARVVASICVIGILLVGLVGTIVLHQVNRQLFDRAVSTHLDQYSSASSRAKAQIETANAPAAGQLQQIANELVASQNNPDGAIVGAALLRSPKQPEATSFEIAEPATESSSRIRTRITAEMKKAVADDDAVHWQSIEVQTSAGNRVPGIIVGSRLNLPGAGYYQFYVAYSLESEEYTTGIVTSILTVGASVFLLFVAVSAALIVRLVLRPVHEASRNASILAQGGFDARMEVKGRDELAQLARSFNQMASSLSDQFTQLERMSKVQQEFVSAVSHELRSPVTTIRMAGQLIYDRRTDLPSVLRRSAELQHDQLINLDVMLSDLLEISRYDAGAMTLASTKADLREIADAVVKAQRPLAESNGVEVIVESRGDTQAKVEPRRIERIVRNLVVNALEHAEGKPVRVLVVGGENAVAVEVSDRGIGLSEEQAAHVFDRFWRADTARVRKSGGTGLGLTIAREDAMLHGGRLVCAGEVGVGSTFLLSVPREVGEQYTNPLTLRVAAAEETWGGAVVVAGPTPESADAGDDAQEKKNIDGRAGEAAEGESHE